jgi:hypothetical protein
MLVGHNPLRGVMAERVGFMPVQARTHGLGCRFRGTRKWLAALDDFRNWLIREAA